MTDGEFFSRLTRGLATLEGFNGTGISSNGGAIHFGLGPHSIQIVEEVCELVKPKTILEIGTSLGYSAAMWLFLSDANLVTVDIDNKSETMHSMQILSARYPTRLTFVHSDSSELEVENCQLIHPQLPPLGPFDLVFIDGNHLLEGVKKDIELVLALGASYVFFDDWDPQYGPGVKLAVEQFKLLKCVKTWPNMSLMTTILTSVEKVSK